MNTKAKTKRRKKHDAIALINFLPLQMAVANSHITSSITCIFEISKKEAAFNPTSKYQYEVCVDGKVENNFRDFCRFVLKKSSKHFNKTVLTSNLHYFKRTMKEGHPFKGIKTPARAEYQRLRKKLDITDF